MITLHSAQPGFAEGFIEEAVGDLWEPWMRQADRLLEDEKLLNIVYDALLRRHPKSRTRGRMGVPAEIVVRMLLLKHIWWIPLSEHDSSNDRIDRHSQLEFRCGRARSQAQPLI